MPVCFLELFDILKLDSCFQLKGHAILNMMEMVGVLLENYDTFEAYNVDKYMTSVALSVDRRYRGRGIGDQFLTSRKAMCREFDIKLTQTVFTSDFSNVNADRAGYKTDRAMRYVASNRRIRIYCILNKFPFTEIILISAMQR